jgi:beta-amylase
MTQIGSLILRQTTAILLLVKKRLLIKVYTGVVVSLIGITALAQEKPERQGNVISYRGHTFNTQWSASGTHAPTVRNYVMGPLELVTDWETFGKSLRILKQNGVEAITTDIWWGLVEAEKGNFQWNYYKSYAEAVKKAGLKWLPILSFHQAGGNVGDTVDIPIPKWVWSESTDMKFVGSNGFVNGEYISFWTPEAYPLYEKVMNSFAKNFAAFDDTIAKVYLSLGPAGELRFPSYNGAAGWNYPDIGFLQSYSERAQNSFRQFLKNKYSNQIARLNAAWSLQFSSFEDNRIRSPGDGAEFFARGVKTAYGQDFLQWYQNTLEQHARTMFTIGNKNLKNTFLSPARFKAPLGGKIAGIHWKMGDTVYPRAAEKAAGYVDYSKFMTLFSNAGAELTFTCMEMYNKDSFPHFSKPQELVKEVLTLASLSGVRVNGENALAISNNSAAYKQIRQVFEKSSLQGFTLLRLGQIIGPDGEATPELQAYSHQVVRSRTQQFLVRTHLSAAEIMAMGYEIRIVGTALNLGNGNPEKGLILNPAGQGDWTGSVVLPHPEGVNFDVVLYNPKTKHSIHEYNSLRRLTGQSERLFVDSFFGKVITMGPMIPLKVSELTPSTLTCKDIFLTKALNIGRR